MTNQDHGSALARVESPTDFGPEHMAIVREAFAPGASEAEFAVMWAGAKARGLDPVRKQIHFVCRFDNQKQRDVWSSQVSIDGFRAIAEATGKYDGQDEPEFEYDKEERLIIARVRVWRKDIGRPFVGVARWSEYVQTKSGGAPTHMWAKMEHTMLAKCAEALGLRKAFPEPLAGLYTGDEMGQAGNESEPRESRPAWDGKSRSGPGAKAGGDVPDADFESAPPAREPVAPTWTPADLDAERVACVATVTDGMSGAGARRRLAKWLSDHRVPKTPTGADALALFDAEAKVIAEAPPS